MYIHLQYRVHAYYFNRLINDRELLLPLQDVTVVKYRRLKNVPLKISCFSIFMIETSGMFFRLPGAHALFQSYDIDVSLWKYVQEFGFKLISAHILPTYQ